MSRKLNLIGCRFGRLEVLRDTGLRRTKRQRLLWAAKCDCGRQILTTTDKLRRGETQSCGCLHAEMLDSARPVLPGELNPKHKLTDDDVISLRLMYSTGEWTQYELADQFNVWQSTVSKVLLGKTWRHVA